MKTTKFLYGLALLLFFTLPVHAAKVAIFGAPNTPQWNLDVSNKVFATGLFTQVDAFLADSSGTTPTLVQLKQYDAVLVYSDSPFANRVAMGDVLADYLETGGRVVLCTFSYTTNDFGIQGRIVSAGYLPFTLANQNEFTPFFSLVADIPNHAILAGVTSFNGGSSSYHNAPITTTSGTTLVAHWSNGQPLVAFKQASAGTCVGLNFYPPSSNARSDFWNATTSGARLMANALLFSAEKNLAAQAGRYFGLFSESSGVSRLSSGYITVAVGQRPYFTGMLFVDGRPASFVGAFDAKGKGVTYNTVIPQGRTTPLTLTIQLGFDDYFTGTLSNTVEHWVADIRADRCIYFSGGQPSSSYSGDYNMLLPTALADLQPPIIQPEASLPGLSSDAGYGYTTINVDTRGIVAAAGYLCDGQPLKPLAAAVSKNGDWPFYAMVGNTSDGSRIKNYHGLVFGWLHFGLNQNQNNTIRPLGNFPHFEPNANQLDPSPVTGPLEWIRAATGTGLYPNGFTNDIAVISSRWSPRGVNFTDGSLLLAGGNLFSPRTYPVTVDGGGTTFDVTDPTFPTRFHYTTSLGIVDCVFRHPDANNLSTRARSLYLPDQDFIGGFFIGTNQSGLFEINNAPVFNQ